MHSSLTPAIVSKQPTRSKAYQCRPVVKVRFFKRWKDVGESEVESKGTGIPSRAGWDWDGGATLVLHKLLSGGLMLVWSALLPSLM